ncbi:hypothetical protein MPSEU_000759200 [Mayamaea pseudoterrestris]|nr:hypothetical protein MPSEU_000759200 [Mayamaea pseudoterrestris]
MRSATKIRDAIILICLFPWQYSLAQTFIDDDSIDYVGCFADLAASDANGDGVLTLKEYETFLQAYSIRACHNMTMTTAEPEQYLDQLSAFETLSCSCRVIPGNLPTCCLGEAARINIAGATSSNGSSSINDDYAFLRSICKVVDATIPEPKCRLSIIPTPAPSVTDNGGTTLVPSITTTSGDGESDTNAPTLDSSTASVSPAAAPTIAIQPVAAAVPPSSTSEPPAATVATKAPNTVSSTPTKSIDYESCYIDMLTADTDFDTFINADEYLGFLQAYTFRVYCHELFSDEQQDESSADTFDSIACLCEQDAPSSCCNDVNAKIDTTAIVVAKRTPKQTKYLQTVCQLTDDAVKKYDECAGSSGETTDGPAAVPTPSNILAEPPAIAPPAAETPSKGTTKVPTAAGKTPTTITVTSPSKETAAPAKKVTNAATITEEFAELVAESSATTSNSKTTANMILLLVGVLALCVV